MAPSTGCFTLAFVVDNPGFDVVDGECPLPGGGYPLPVEVRLALAGVGWSAPDATASPRPDDSLSSRGVCGLGFSPLLFVFEDEVDETDVEGCEGVFTFSRFGDFDGPSCLVTFVVEG